MRPVYPQPHSAGELDRELKVSMIGFLPVTNEDNWNVTLWSCVERNRVISSVLHIISALSICFTKTKESSSIKGCVR